ncbi:MAG: AbrB/MazE/SpoVT family DNA-binding domain-containing protein [Pseudomonadota bacterium]
MTTIKVTTVGNSSGIVLPKDVLTKLRVSKGDKLYAIETPYGVELTSYDPEFSSQMDVAEKIMLENRDILKKLAE